MQEVKITHAFCGDIHPEKEEQQSEHEAISVWSAISVFS
jgi:hypothetical protein